MIELKVCKKCRWWRPDAILIYVGECEIKRISTRESEGPCEDFAERVEAEFMWCSDCRETFHKSEKERHREHSIHQGAHVDEDAHEYIQAGD
ncbi:MAG: hypothetical protein QXZ09_03095 [Candidatus Methanomethylicaceae archaeon]